MVRYCFLYFPLTPNCPNSPGRFFVANELKTMFAHIVMTYDVKLEDGTAFPPSMRIGPMVAANPHAKVMFRNRVD